MTASTAFTLTAYCERTSMRRNKIIEPDERINPFRVALYEAGFSAGTSYNYAKGARVLVLSGCSLTQEGLGECFHKLRYDNIRQRQVHKTGAKLFIEFINGREIIRHDPVNKTGVRGRRNVWKGCDEDCFNCKYPDCYKPEYKILTHDEEY